MEIKYFTQNITLTDTEQKFLEEKVRKLGRFSKKIWEARVDLSYSPTHHNDQLFRLEINLRMPDKMLRGVSRTPDFRTAVDQVMKKLKKQMERYRGAWQTKKRQTRKAVRKKKTG